MTLYSPEKNVQILVGLLKEAGVSKVVASPGNTNVAFVATIMNDDHFTVYSVVDERSAGYVACGLAEALGEPVVLSCTGATASRNYLPSMTEAFYRRLPLLVITSTQPISRVGHLIPQVIDRSIIPADAAVCSELLRVVETSQDAQDCAMRVNRALLALTRRGGGPVHINLETSLEKPFVSSMGTRGSLIKAVDAPDKIPELPGKKIAVFIGSHAPFLDELSDAIDVFCERNGAVVFCDHSSRFYGKFALHFSLVAAQSRFEMRQLAPDLVIHIGEISGDYFTPKLFKSAAVWRVSEDGEPRSPFGRLERVFRMREIDFFNSAPNVTQLAEGADPTYFDKCRDTLITVRERIPEELPFSNVWIAKQLSGELPTGSYAHLGILSSLRAWNFFDVPQNIATSANVGGFGIDGPLSTAVGIALADSQRLVFAYLGDLATFYDLNILGNRHLPPNLRILVVNNGKGVEFRHLNHHASYFGEAADEFVAAAGHNGNMSRAVLRSFTEALGLLYIAADSKESFESAARDFLGETSVDRALMFECFVDPRDEVSAQSMLLDLVGNARGRVRHAASKTKAALKEKFRP